MSRTEVSDFAWRGQTVGWLGVHISSPLQICWKVRTGAYDGFFINSDSESSSKWGDCVVSSAASSSMGGDSVFSDPESFVMCMR